MTVRSERIRRIRAIAETAHYNPEEAANAQVMLDRETGIEGVALTPIKRSQQMLAEAKTLPDLKNLRDYATGAKAWAKARGMGVGAENEAAEVILRAERKIGEMLGLLRDSGQLAGEGWQGRTSVIAASSVMRIEDLGMNHHQATDYRRVAALPDDTFEKMLEASKVEGYRLAKYNFYNAIKEPKAPSTHVTPTAEDGGFDMFRQGAYALLGWSVNDDGVGGPTKNGLTALPNDELRQTAFIVQALISAYHEAKVQRG